MNISNLKITLLENTPFLREDGTFDRDRAMDFCGKIGGICYNEDGLMASFAEPDEKTQRRIQSTTSGEHQSVYEHLGITMYLKDSSKMNNMVLHSGRQYASSERSLRYTLVKENGCNLTKREIMLYNKWFKIFYDLINYENETVYKKTGDGLRPKKIETLAKENARYMCSTFINTEMVHTIPFAQLNRMIRYMKDYINKENKDEFEERLSKDFEMFIAECERLNLSDERLQSNRKHRKIELFDENIESIPECFDVTYSTNYTGSLALVAQRQRHRIDQISIERNPSNGWFVPPLLENHPELVKQWLEDLESVRNEVPQGELVSIHEEGSYNNFIKFLKERDCSAPQLEIFRQANATKEKYYKALVEKEHPYAKRLEPYMGKRRCGYPDYDCPRPCGFREGINGTRRV